MRVRWRATEVVLVLGGVALISGCGGGSSGGWSAGQNSDSDPAPLPIDEAEFRPRVYDLLCLSTRRCCEAAGKPFDADACPTLAILNEGGLKSVYDAGAAAACLAYLAEPACEKVQLGPGYYPSSGQLWPGNPCYRVYAGKAQLGEDCNNGRTCAQPPGGVGVCTEEGLSEPTGVCEHWFRAARGAACDRTCSTIAGGPSSCLPSAGVTPVPLLEKRCMTDDGNYCTPEGVCSAQVASGKPCADHPDACGADNFCSAGICAPRLPQGAPCTGAWECASENCGLNASCDAASPETGPALPLACGT
jgi:hypothetical protein